MPRFHLGLARHLEQPLPKKHDMRQSLINAGGTGPQSSNDVNTSSRESFCDLELKVRFEHFIST